MTDKYVIMGNPVSHSMSPAIQNYFAELYDQNLHYDRLLVEYNTFAQKASNFFLEGGSGCNITVPCKIDAYNFADNLSTYAKAAGAVNTLKKLSDGSIFGDNTDGRGLIADFDRIGYNLYGKRILIIGAGGAARGIILPLLERQPKSISVVNRNELKAFDLAKMHPEIKVVLYSSLKPDYDLIINATSSSLQGVLPPVSSEVLSASQCIYDLMYSPKGKTRFVEEGKRLGVLNCFDGFGMLLGQAALSFELWRGVKPDLPLAYEHFSKVCGR